MPDAEKDAGRAEAFAAVEEELSAYTSRGSVASPQWPWHALDRARRRILPPGVCDCTWNSADGRPHGLACPARVTPPEVPMPDADYDAGRCCPGAGTMAHVRGCRNHPEAERA